MSAIVSIDFSILSTAAVRYTEDGTEFFSFPAMESKYYGDWFGPRKLKKYDVHKEIEDKVTIVPYIKFKQDTDNYQEGESLKIANAIRLTDKIFEAVKPDLGDIFVFEGFSYMSKGASFIDLIEFNSILRYRLAKVTGSENIFIIPPTDNKKAFTGKGNADKLAMYDAFVNSVYGGDFRQFLIDSNGKYIDRKKREVEKPIDDIIDAYSLLFSYMTLYLK